MGALAAIATVAGGIGTAINAYGTIAGGGAQEQAYQRAGQGYEQAGIAKQRAAEYEALQLEEKARLEREAGRNELATAQVEAGTYKRRKELALSSLQARAASSGFTATDPTSLALADEIARYGTLEEDRAVAGGTVKRAAAFAQARSFDASAGGRRFEGEAERVAAHNQAEAAYYAGRAARKKSYFDAASTILGGISTIAGRFNPSAGSGEISTPISEAYDPATGWRTTTHRTTRYRYQ